MSDEDQQVSLPTQREVAGLPVGRIARVLHPPGSGKTIVEVELPGAPSLHRLFWRLTGESRYQLLADPGEGVSHENMIYCSAPVVFARVVGWKPQGSGFAGGTLDVLRVRLTDSPAVETLSLADLLPPDASVSRLLRADDPGVSLDAIVLLREPTGRGAGKRARYIVCTLDLSNGRMIERDTLPGRRF